MACSTVKYSPPTATPDRSILHHTFGSEWPKESHSSFLFVDAGISHISENSSADCALSAGSQTKTRLMNFKNLSFSCPGSIAVTKFSSDTSGMGGSAIHWPAEQLSESIRKKRLYGIPTVLVEVCLDGRILGLLNHPLRWRAHVTDILAQS